MDTKNDKHSACFEWQGYTAPPGPIVRGKVCAPGGKGKTARIRIPARGKSAAFERVFAQVCTQSFLHHKCSKGQTIYNRSWK